MIKLSNIHDFHMVLNSKLKNEIKNLSVKLNKSISDTAVYIIDTTINIFKKQYYLKEELSCFTKYKNISWDETIHIYFNEDFYRKIKHLCDNFHAFSIAIVIRWLFNYYFDNLCDKKNVKENERILKKIKNEIDNYENTIKCWKKNIEDQQLSGYPYYQLTFNNKFCVVGFKFLL